MASESAMKEARALWHSGANIEKIAECIDQWKARAEKAEGKGWVDCAAAFTAKYGWSLAVTPAEKSVLLGPHREAQTDAHNPFIIDAHGVVRAVRGALPITKDGEVIGDDCKVFYEGHVVNAELFRSSVPGESDWHPFHPRKAYSTREAAEQAREGGKHG